MSKSHGMLHPAYRPDIDGLRAIAVLAVVGFHAFPGRVTGGFVGVDVFFVISGFLISSILISNLERGNFSLAEFYARRIRRIFPALLCVLIASLLFGWVALLAGEFRQLGEHIAAGAAFVSNLVLWRESGYFDIDAEAKPLLHLWSLGIEEQYYIVWPLVLWLAARIRMNLLWAAAGIAILSFALNVNGVHADPIGTFYSPLSRVWELLAGSMLAWVNIHKPQSLNGIPQRLRHAGSFAGFVMILCGILLVDRHAAFPGWWALLPVVGTTLVIAAGPQAVINRSVLSRRIMVWFGLISFPLYLWHWPLLSFGFILENEAPSKQYRLLCVVAAVILAWATYRFIEVRVRRNTAGANLVRILVGLMIATGLAGLLIYKAQGVPSRRVVIENLSAARSVEMTSNPEGKCPTAGTVTLPGSLCTRYASEHPRKTIVLWGDSSTGAWLPVFRDIGQRMNDAVINVMHLSCPPILDARKTRFDVPEARLYCKDGQTQRQVIEYLRSLQPDLIVTIGAWNSYSPHSNREFITDRDGTDADPASTRRVISVKFPETLDTLAAIAPTLVFESWPIMPGTPKARTVSALGISPKVMSVDRDEFEADSRAARTAIARAARIRTFDPATAICSETRCDSVVGGVSFYADRYHVTPEGAMQLRPALEAAISSILRD